MKIEFTLKSIVLLTIFSAIVGFLLANAGLILYSLKSIKVSFAGDIVAASGNLIGGLIGGIVAYIVASYQVKKTYDLEKNKKHAGNSAILRLISTELQANSRLLVDMKESYLQSNNKEFLLYISSEQWNKCSTSIGIEISDDTLSSLMSVYNRLNLLKDEGRTLTSNEYERLLEHINQTVHKVNNDLSVFLNG